MDPFFYILTRTSDRPNYFSQCCESIDQQTYKNFKHIVCTDSESSIDYIKNKNREFLYIEKLKEFDGQSIKYSPYNLYFNKMYELVGDGYIIFIDDDDCFTSMDSLNILASIIKKAPDPTNSLYFWQVNFPNNLLIPRDPSNFIFKPGNVSGIGFCFHSSYKNVAQWDQYKESDFRVAHKLKIVCTNSYIFSIVLTGIQRTTGMGGFGGRDDK